MSAVASLPSVRPQRRALVGVLTFILVGVVPAVLTTELLVVFAEAGRFALDFHRWYFPSGLDVLHGRSPLPPPRADAPLHGYLYPAGPYPAPVAVLFAPFALAPPGAAATIFASLLFLGVIGALCLLRVRDWRCYGATFGCAAVFSGLQAANLSLLLVFGTAALWRYRDRRWVAAIIAGLMLSLKLFLWPVAVWLVVTRRFRTAALSIAVAAALTLACWAIVGLRTIQDYPAVLRIYTHYYERSSYTPFALALTLGAPETAARAAGAVCTLLAIGAILVARRRNANDETIFLLAIVAALVATPIVWLHYFALILVPLALLQPSFSWVWLLPAFLWLCPMADAPSPVIRSLPFVVTGAILALAHRRRGREFATRGEATAVQRLGAT